MNPPLKMYWKATCSKCGRAVDLLRELGVPYEEREYSEIPLTEEEIWQIAVPDRVLELLSPHRSAYREHGFDLKPPTPAEAVEAMARESNLMYRPILVRGDDLVLGFDEDAIRKLIIDPA